MSADSHGWRRKSRAALARLLLAGCLGAAALAAGCQRPTVSEPLTQTLGAADADTQLEFWHQLADRPVTSNDEAFHGLLLYLEGEPAAADYDDRVQALKARGVLPAGFSEPADLAVSRGTLAVAVAKALSLKGGMMMQVLPDNPRYAVRELVYLNLFPQSSPNQTFSGSEFLGIVGRMEDWQRSNPLEQQNLQLAPEGAPAEAPAGE